MKSTDEERVSATERRFRKYVDGLAEVIGHADRVEPLRGYTLGLLLPGDRKSVEPMAARIGPQNVRSTHQSLHHFVSSASWSDRQVLAKVREAVLPAIERHGAIQTWIIDDTGIPKKGTRSVGVAHQYCGQLGKQANCQVAVSLSIANTFASLPISYRLYLPQEWADDAERRQTAGVPVETRFATKTQMAVAQLRTACSDGVPRGVVVADAAYGNDTNFRQDVTDLGLTYMLAIQGSTTVWRPGEQPLPPAKRTSQRGRAPSTLRRTKHHAPIAVEELAAELPAATFRTITWREGSNAPLRSRFAAVRVRPAHRDTQRSIPRAEEWLLIEWPKDAPKPRKYWLCTANHDATLASLVTLAQSRWRIERDYQELKDEIGLNHYEGRSWRGFHHHATLCIAAYAFLIAERGAFSPSADIRARLRQPKVSDDFRPRGASGARRTS